MLNNKKDIEMWLNKMNIFKYNIKEDLTVDVEGNVNIGNKKLHSIPIKFGKINGFFICSSNMLTDLQNIPDKILGYFDCSFNNLTNLNEMSNIYIKSSFLCNNNNLTSLQGCPDVINGDFNCSKNNLSNLLFSPQEINGNFNCNNNIITSLQHCPPTIKKNFYCSHNKISSFQYCPKEINGNFYIDYNPIMSLSYLPEKIHGNISFLSNNAFPINELLKFNSYVNGQIHNIYNTSGDKNIFLELVDKIKKINKEHNDFKKSVENNKINILKKKL